MLQRKTTVRCVGGKWDLSDTNQNPNGKWKGSCAESVGMEKKKSLGKSWVFLKNFNAIFAQTNFQSKRN